MEERSNKTIMCSILFLDIIEYSKKSVSGQISLKDRFNSYLSAAISDVPVADRIILDTGDGAAINFLGDVEDALKAALSLRESILSEGTQQDTPLLVRAGINLGPVRLVRDINGQPNIVGDGINVAQRIMSFAEADQILVSRSYYDAVSRLSPQYAGMFSYQGSRTDKHVREHEVYAIGHLGEKTADMIATNLHEIQKEKWTTRFAESARNGWNAVAIKCNDAAGNLRLRLAQANPRQRTLYAGVVAVPVVVLIGALMFKLAHNGEAPALPAAEQTQVANDMQPASAVASAAPDAQQVDGKAAETAAEAPPAAKPEPRKTTESRTARKKVTESKTAAGGSAKPAAKPRTTESTIKSIFTGTDSDTENLADAHISITCPEGTQIFVDGADKGKVVAAGLNVAVSPGKHKIIITSRSGDLYTENVVLEPGKTLRIRPGFCN